jgi:hypothetical protein
MDFMGYEYFFILILVLGFLIRIIPSFLFKIDSPDTFYHLTVARQIWREKKIPKKLNSFLFEGTFSYPPLFQIFLIPLIIKNQLIFGRLISPTIDIFIGVLVYLVARDSFGVEIGLISFILYLLIPINVIESIKLTPRPLGQFFFVMFMFSIFYSTEFQIEFFLISIISVVGILLSHKMATQSLIMISIMMAGSFLFLDWNYSIFISTSLTLGILSTIVISQGFYLKIFQGHKAVLLHHFKFGDFRNGEKKFGSPFQIIQRWPWIILFPLPLIFSENITIFSNKDLSFLLIWGLFFIAMSILWRFGSAFRYIVFATPPLCIIFAYSIWTEFNDWVFVFLIFALGMSLARITYYFKRQYDNPLITHELHDCFKYLKNLPEESLGCIPPSLNYQTAFFTEKKILAGEATPEQFEKKRDYFSFAKDEYSLLNTIQAFKTKYFLVDYKNPIGKKFETIINESKKLSSSILYERGSYKIYEISLR